MNPPSVYELTTPDSHSSNNTTKSVHNMVILTSAETLTRREEQRGGTADHAVRIASSSTCHAMPRPGRSDADALHLRGCACKSCTVERSTRTSCKPHQHTVTRINLPTLVHGRPTLVHGPRRGTKRAHDFSSFVIGAACREGVMRGLFGLGIILVLLGIAILAWPAIPYTERKKAVDIGPIEVETETQKQVVLPPVLGIAAAGSGVVLIALGRRNAYR